MEKFVEVLPNKSALVQRALTLVQETIQTAIQQKGRCTIALAGGNTPKPLYEAMAETDLPWPKLHVFWGDERYVPADHPDSNQRMARLAWLDRIAIPPGNIHPMPTNAASAEEDAALYNSELQKFFGCQTGEFPQFDIILLGLGDDGHTASLFPHTEALQVCDRLVTVGNKDGQPRLTFTVPLINGASRTIFLVAGDKKQSALSKILAPFPETSQAKQELHQTYPASLIQPSGELWWLLDEAANPKS